MDLFLQKTPLEQKIFVEEVAARTGKSPVVIEKDYWVCWMLRQLFSISEISSHLTFKGGTSLSKVYRVIGRFSEDIDLAIHREFLGFGGEKEPEAAPSNKKRDRRVDELQEACTVTVQSRLLPKLKERFTAALVLSPDMIELASNDPRTILFRYPRSLGTEEGYIRPYVKVEIGARSDDWPLEQRQVISYLEEELEAFLAPEACEVNVLAAERTFWEKATILHAEYHRPLDKIMPDRLSRHYYDLYCLARHKLGERAVGKVELLERVAVHKRVFFRSGWANYHSAKPGTLRLMPASARIKELQSDYNEMREMFFDEPPPFTEVLEVIARLEERINKGG